MALTVTNSNTISLLNMLEQEFGRTGCTKKNRHKSIFASTWRAADFSPRGFTGLDGPHRQFEGEKALSRTQVGQKR